MSLDDSLRGVRSWAFAKGWPVDRVDEIRNTYNKARVSYEVSNPAPVPNGKPDYQVSYLGWIHRGERYAATITRDYVYLQQKSGAKEMMNDEGKR